MSLSYTVGSVGGMCVCVVVGSLCCCCDTKQEHLCVLGVRAWVSGNNIGEAGAKALGPHLAKLVKMNALGLNGTKRGWDVCVRGGWFVVLLL